MTPPVNYRSPRLYELLPRLLAGLAAALLTGNALAINETTSGPWIAPGDSGLRSDIQVLADAGIITAPVSTWPLSWNDIKTSLDTFGKTLRPYEQAALDRLLARYYEETTTEIFRPSAYISLAENPRLIRTFDDEPREDAEIGVGISWTGKRFAANVQVQYVDDPSDGDEWRFDQSYLGVALGNWMLSAGARDQWWGPGWQGSLIFGNNARPIPSVMLERNSTAAFDTKWLSWLGPWDLSVMYGFLEDDRAVPNAQVFAMRFNIKPLPSLELGLSRSTLWCGDGQSCSASTFVVMLLGSGTDDEFDNLAGFDIRWSFNALGQPFALYSQFIGEDGEFVPSDYLGQFGGETWGYWDRIGNYRFFLEWSDTECDFRFRRSIRNDSGPGSPSCAYTKG